MVQEKKLVITEPTMLQMLVVSSTGAKPPYWLLGYILPCQYTWLSDTAASMQTCVQPQSGHVRLYSSGCYSPNEQKVQTTFR